MIWSLLLLLFCVQDIFGNPKRYLVEIAEGDKSTNNDGEQIRKASRNGINMQNKNLNIMSTSEISVISSSEISDVSSSEITDVSSSEITDVSSSEISDVSSPEKTDVSLPEKTDTSSSEISDISSSETSALSPTTEASDIISTSETSALSQSTDLRDPSYFNNDSSLFEGDIILTQGQRAMIESKVQVHNMMKNSEWPKGIIPVQFTNQYTNSEKCIIKKFLTELNLMTCVKFVPRKGEKRYVQIRKEGNNCASGVGYSLAHTYHYLTLSTNCITGGSSVNWPKNT